MHGDSNLSQTAPGFSREPGFVPASNLTDGGEFCPALEGALGQILLNRGGADSCPACTCGAGARPVREFPQFEHGAGI
jgi:hypothetical protein